MRSVRWCAVAAPVTLWTAAVSVPIPALATPAVNADSVVISQATVDGMSYVTKEVTIAPGGSTGWHFHIGQAFAIVREGTLTRTMADCSDIVSPAGSPVVEESGADHVHVGRNLGPVPVKMWVDYITPVGIPERVDVPSPGCNVP